MNPNATSFKPTPTVSVSTTRSQKIKYLTDHILVTTQEQTVENIKLHDLHKRMQHYYSTLSQHAEATRLKLTDCLPQSQIVQMMSVYKMYAAQYKEQHSKVNDFSASIMTLKLRLNKLKLTEEATPSPPPKSLQSNPAKRSKSTIRNLFSGKISMTKLDGMKKRSSITKLSNALPAIMQSRSHAVHSTRWSDSEEEEESDFDFDSDSESISEEITTDLLCAETLSERSASPDLDDAYSQQEMSATPAPIISVSTHVREQLLPDDQLLDTIEDTEMERIAQEMDSILKMTTFGHHRTITVALNTLLDAHCHSMKALCLVINCILNEAVCHKPRVPTLSVQCYAKMLWTIKSHCNTLRHRQDDAFKMLDFCHLLWQKMRIVFREVQVGGTSQEFVNVMVLMAELYNGRLLQRSNVVEVMDLILGPRHVERVGESEIEGLYEIFKRCSGRFRTSPRNEDMVYYLSVLRTVSLWNRFSASASSSRYRSVPFMVDEMHRHFYFVQTM